MKIDTQKLKSDIQDYYGTAMFNVFSAAIMDVKDVSSMSEEQLREEASKIGLDLTRYEEDF